MKRKPNSLEYAENVISITRQQQNTARFVMPVIHQIVRGGMKYMKTEQKEAEVEIKYAECPILDCRREFEQTGEEGKVIPIVLATIKLTHWPTSTVKVIME